MPAPPKIDTKAALRMKLKGVSDSDIAKSQGVTRGAVYKKLKPLLEKIPGAEYRAEYQDQQADILDSLAAGIISSITQKDLKRASLLSKVNCMGVLIDKSRLIRGQSTSNSISVLLARHVHLNEPAPPTCEVIEIDDDL